jgi:hypothetical protein
MFDPSNPSLARASQPGLFSCWGRCWRRKLKRFSAAVATSREGHRSQACDYSPHYGQWPSLLLSGSGIARREGEMTDWVLVLIVALIVVCATAYLLLDPKFRQPKHSEDR